MINREYFKGTNLVFLDGYTRYSLKDEEFVIYVKGDLVIEDTIVDYISWLKKMQRWYEEDSKSFFQHLASELNRGTGCFSLILKLADTFFLVSDISRSSPVFYGKNGEITYITDNPVAFQDKYGSQEYDIDGIEEYVAAGYVFSNRTIFKDTYGIQAGEIVRILDGSYDAKRYFKFKPDHDYHTYESPKDFASLFKDVLSAVFSRMIEQAPNDTRWIIPLSGGHDSRLIVSLLHKLGQKNVLCYSYGILGNEQSSLSKQVANAIGYEWYFIEYTSEKWDQLFVSEIVDEYFDYAFRGVSTPHLQDFLAIHELKEKGTLKKGDIFVPGHAFDFVAGSNLFQADIECTDEESAVLRVSKRLTRIKSRSSSPYRSIQKLLKESGLKPNEFQEFFNWQELRAKFLVNAVRGYEFFGFDFRLPFWDKELIDFWLRVPPVDRKERRLFLESEKLGILEKELEEVAYFGKSDRVKISGFESMLGKVLPMSIKTLILRIIGRKVQYNAGLNQIYEKRTSTVQEFLYPHRDFPRKARRYFAAFLKRFPYQIDYHFLSSLYSLRREFDKKK